MNAAAKEGHLDVLEWLHENSNDQCNASTMHIAARNGSLDVVKWLISKNYDWEVSSFTMYNAARSGNLELVKWLYSNSSDRFLPAMDGAARSGHLEIIKWLHYKRVEGCTTQAVAVDWAAGNGQLEVVKWLHTTRTEGCTTRAMDKAAMNGHLAVVQWLHYNRSEGCITAAMTNAIKNNHFDVVLFLNDHRSEDFDSEAIILENPGLELTQTNKAPVVFPVPVLTRFCTHSATTSRTFSVCRIDLNETHSLIFSRNLLAMASSRTTLDGIRNYVRPAPVVIPHGTLPSHCFKHHVGKSLEHLVLRVKGEATTFANAKSLSHAMGGKTVDLAHANGTRRTADRFVGWGLRKLNGFKSGGQLSADRIAEVNRVLEMLKNGQPMTPEMLRAEGYDLVLSKAYNVAIGNGTGEMTAFLDITTRQDITVIRTTQDLQNLNVNAQSIQELVNEKCSLWQFRDPDFLQTAGKNAMGNPQEKVLLDQAAKAKNVSIAIAVVCVVVVTALFAAKVVKEEATTSDAIKYGIDLGMIAVGYVVGTSVVVTTTAATAGIALVFIGASLALHYLVDVIMALADPKIEFRHFEVVPFASYFGPSLFSRDQGESQFTQDAALGAREMNHTSTFAAEQCGSAFAQEQKAKGFARNASSPFS